MFYLCLLVILMAMANLLTKIGANPKSVWIDPLGNGVKLVPGEPGFGETTLEYTHTRGYPTKIPNAQAFNRIRDGPRYIEGGCHSVTTL